MLAIVANKGSRQQGLPSLLPAQAETERGSPLSQPIRKMHNRADAALVGDCLALTRLQRRLARMRCNAEAGSRREKACEGELKALWREEDALIAQVCDARAQTPEGHMARARMIHDRVERSPDEAEAFGLIRAMLRDFCGETESLA